MAVSAVLEALAKPESEGAVTEGVSTKVAVEEYLTRERASKVRHDYLEGEIVPVAGTSLTHNKIAGNIYSGLRDAFRGRDCEVFIESIRVRISPVRYRYPDVTALCGDPETDTTNPPALLNPALIVEVLSSSTEETDLGDKFFEYKQIPTLTDYVLIAQDRVSVTHWSRTGDRAWSIREWVELSDTFILNTLEATLTLADLYQKVTFPKTVST